MTRTAIAVMIGALFLIYAPGCAAAVVYWTPAHELAPDLLAGFLAWGDLDGDGDEDVAAFYRGVYASVGCPGPPSWVLEADTFPDVTGCTENSGTLGDCDADGDLDLIYGCYECCYLQVVWNAGTPQTPLWQWGGGAPGNANVGHGARACLGDLDADGDPDFVGTNFSGVIWGAMNNGTPQAPYWDSAASVPGIGTGDSSGKLALADLDGDGDLDIVGATSFGRLKCWENLGTPQTWSFAESPGMLTGITQPTNGIHGIALPDVDCDGDADLLVAGWSSLEYLYLNERITPVRPCTWGTIKAIYR